MRSPLCKEEIRRLLSIEPNKISGALPVSRLSPKDLEAREVAIATLQLAQTEGWRPNDAQKRGGRNHAAGRIGAIVYRWGALIARHSELPDHLRDHPFADETVKTLQAQLAEEGIHCSIGTIISDLKGLKVRKTKKTG